MLIDIVTSRHAFHIRAAYAMRDVIKEIPGVNWDHNARVWVAPRTPAIAERLVGTLNRVGFNADEQFYRYANLYNLATRDEDRPIPLCVTPPWKHQRAAYHFARRLPAAMLAMEMGTGKSLVAASIAANSPARRILILSPLSVVGVWPRELGRHVPGVFRVLPLRTKSTDKKAAELEKFLGITKAQNERAVVVVNYESAWRERMAVAIERAGFDMMILDESHRLKAPGGKASLFCFRMSKRIPRRLLLTGTPMPHGPLDVYAQFRALDVGIFGLSFNHFKQKFAVLGGPGNQIVVNFRNLDDLRFAMGRCTFRVKKEDAIDLPPRVFNELTVELSPAARKVYDDLEADFYTKVGTGEITASNAMVTLLRLQQITSGVVQLDDEEKVTVLDPAKRTALNDLIEDHDPDRPIVVFCRFRHDLDTVRELAAAHGRRYGEVSGRQKDLTPHSEMPDNIDIMGVQIQSGGVGIDLTRASTAVFFSCGFSLGDYLQACDRLHRPGQVHHVTYYHMIAKDTVDEAVYGALRKKQRVVDSILAGVKNYDGRSAASA